MNSRGIGAAAAGESNHLASDVVAISRPSGAKPLLVQALPVSAATNEATAVLLITDPDAPATGDPTEALLLLGLTPAEARTAALVGSGLSRREAAIELGLTEGTVNITLNQVYSKVGLKRASELAAFVSRIASPTTKAGAPRSLDR